MKIKVISSILIFSCFLAACAPKTPDSTTISAGIYTAVAQTLTAQYTPMLETGTPAEIPTETPAPTEIAFFTDTPGLPTATINYCDNSVFVSDVTIPDSTVMTAGTKFTKTWTIQNIGTCAWTSTYSLKFASGTQMSGTTTAIGSSVAPNSSINVSVTMTAPTTPGTYTGYWRMVNDSSEFFGGYVSVKIVVVAAPTVTMTLTPTTTKTVTPTPAATETPWIVTATPNPPSPTDTYTVTPTP